MMTTSLDSIITSILSESFADEERKNQIKQAQRVTKEKLHAKKKNDKKEFEEAEDDELPKKSQKITADPEKSVKMKLKQKVDAEPPGTQDSSGLSKPTKKELDNPNFNDLIKNINLLRGGKSIKDPTVRPQLKAYIDSLPQKDKREALILFNSMARILSGVTTADDALKPDSAVSAMPSKDEPAEASNEEASEKSDEAKKEKPKKTTVKPEDDDVIVVGG